MNKPLIKEERFLFKRLFDEMEEDRQAAEQWRRIKYRVPWSWVVGLIVVCLAIIYMTAR